MINKKFNEELKKNFYMEDVYNWKSKNKVYLLERLENIV